MAASIYPRYPPELSSAQEDYLLSNIKTWSLLNGLAVRPSPAFISSDIDPSGSLAVTAPVTLFPSLFPKTCFEEAKAIQKAYNILYSSISTDEGWLKSIVEELAEVDDFIASLWDIHLAVKSEGYVQGLSLGLFRSDYMIHVDPGSDQPEPKVKQVEFNTIASSFGGLSNKVSDLHQYLANVAAYPTTERPLITPTSLPPNDTIASLSLGLSAAHSAYGSSRSTPPLPLCILFIVSDKESNIFDQQHLATRLQTHHKVPTFRLPFDQTLATTSITNLPSRPLVYAPSHSPAQSYEVTTLYYRAAYSPDHYPNVRSWQARLHLERSAAIKCPSVLTQLAGSKKVQQVLATPSSVDLARFITDPETALSIRDTFAAIYPLDDTAAGKEAKYIATDESKSHGYVLKPQREGGGNNVYRSKIPEFLEGLGQPRKWRSHILMELIEPPRLTNTIFRNGKMQSGEVIGELGIYGVCLWRQDGEILENWQAGHLLRTKGSESEEGGVAAGFGAVDSVCLVDV